MSESILTTTSFDTLAEQKPEDKPKLEQKDESQVLEQERSYLVSEVEYKKLLRKLDIHLLPFISLLYLLSFLDRANIGNARIAGLGVDLHLDGLKYNVNLRYLF
ncbi:hypothetical protein H0H81_007653 [Sphagnurus paluster]|uniref:Uncharacterized protein n=1 Tax=Sphagnurus paluster TaxID=117069 RepID=A0A9P7G1B9_9AGAR|nr:hypothetical protein H0H81_007653 [Sphagnurus paluster]